MENVLAIIESGSAQLLPVEELKKKLEKTKPLTIKLGVDPTAPDLHLGHCVVLEKLKQLQDLGHKVIFLIGDFTAQIGDPTGRSKTRPPLSKDEIAHNMKSYFEQVGRILDKDKTTIRYNAEWFKDFSPEDFIKLLSKVTLAKLVERDDFAKRIANQEAVAVHELLYPILQAYDSVALQSDIEIGGTDQTFNLLMGRFIQEQFGQEPQIIVTMPLLEGLDGVQKMSKSLGNAIGLSEPADQAFGKLMSIPDDLMWRYYKLLLQIPADEISQMQERVAYGTLHPMAAKKDLAYKLVSKYWSEDEAEKARTQFEALFQKKDYSQANVMVLPEGLENPIWIVKLLKTLGAVKSSSDAKRLIESNAVEIDESPVADFHAEITWQPGMIVKVGKHRFYKLSASKA